MDTERSAALAALLAPFNLGEKIKGVAGVLDDLRLGLVSEDLLLNELQDSAKLSLDESLDVFEAVYESFIQPFLARGGGDTSGTLPDRFSAWVAEAAGHLEPQRAGLAGKPSLSLELETTLAASNTWRAIVILEVLAQRGQLVGAVNQNRRLREAFAAWLSSAVKDRTSMVGYALPPSEQWNAPLVALLLEYILEVELKLQGLDAQGAAMVVGQRLAQATGDHRYATIVYGDEGRNEFVWRPVRVTPGGSLEFAN